jgi:hypothetical protein
MYARFVAIADILFNFIPETLHRLTNFRRWYPFFDSIAGIGHRQPASLRVNALPR